MRISHQILAHGIPGVPFALGALLAIGAILASIGFGRAAAAGAGGTSHSPADGLTPGVEVRGESWSDASGRGGELWVSFPLWEGDLPRIGATSARGRVGLRALADAAAGAGSSGNLSPGIDRVELHASSGRFKLSLGQGNVRWGAGRYATLILDDRAPTYPFIRGEMAAEARFGKVEYSRLMGKLGPAPDTYLLGHRLDLSPRPDLRLGITEIAIANGKFASIPTNWIPLWPFYLTQHLASHSGVQGINDASNEYLGLDLVATILPGTTVYGEFLVDDMPSRPENPGVYQIAFLAGGTTEFTETLKLDAEYARVNNYTYTFRVPARSYLNDGRLLGFRFGPDTDRLIVMLRKEFGTGESGAGGLGTAGIGSGEIWAGIEVRRRGEGRIGDRWQDIGWQEARKRSFLSGVVEKTSLFRIDVRLEFAPGADVEGGLAFGHIDNRDNVQGVAASTVEWNFGLRYSP